MNKLVRTGVAVAAGGLVYTGLNFENGLIDRPAHEVNADLEACARALGTTATTVTALPAACTNYKDFFERTTRTVSVYSPNTRTTEQTESSTSYATPAGSDFFTKHYISPEQEARDKLRNHRFAAGLAIFASGLLFIMNRPEKTTQVRNNHEPATVLS